MVYRLMMVVTILVLTHSPGAELQAQVTAEQRKELSTISRDLRKAQSLVTRRKYKEADAAFAALEERLKALNLPKENPSATIVSRKLEIQRAALARKQNGGRGPAKKVSFEKEVAPILKAKCTRCHANNPRGGLRLDTFAGLEAGGTTGALLFRGSPQRSLLIGRLTAPANMRMPRNGDALPQKELETIANWITQGAEFDGRDKRAQIGSGATTERPAVTINRATGADTVSFSKDIAPFMVNLCVRCHSGNNPRSGFSLETFERLMQGGDSGRVVLPGNIDGSRLWDLAGKQDPIKMPPGQALITRTNWNNLRTWIQEGARFDGEDPKAAIRSIVPTAEGTRMAELAKLTPEQFVDLRLKRSEELWKEALPKERARFVEARETIVFGNVAADRLTEISDWAEAQAKQLRTMFADRDSVLWKGKLTVYVIKDRFGFEEFNLVISERETPREVVGDSQVTTDFSDAYVVLQDVGDIAGADNKGMFVNLVENLSGAYLKKGGGDLPDWLIRGTGLVLASKSEAGKENAYLNGLGQLTAEALKSLTNPQDVFADGTFAPSDVGPVGFSLVGFMIKAGGTAKFTRFIRSIQAGNNVGTAAQSAYRADLKSLSAAFLNGARGR